jgi:type VI secretion system protein ImpA
MPDAESVSAPVGRAGEGPMNVEIRTREEALLMIDKVIAYFERNEPTNPAPLLIKRARRLVSMSFVDIIKDMAPESLKQIETIAGAGRDA